MLRTDRLHVIGCRCKKDQYFVVVKDTDNSEFEIVWQTWISLGGVNQQWWKNA